MAGAQRTRDVAKKDLQIELRFFLPRYAGELQLAIGNLTAAVTDPALGKELDNLLTIMDTLIKKGVAGVDETDLAKLVTFPTVAQKAKVRDDIIHDFDRSLTLLSEVIIPNEEKLQGKLTEFWKRYAVLAHEVVGVQNTVWQSYWNNGVKTFAAALDKLATDAAFASRGKANTQDNYDDYAVDRNKLNYFVRDKAELEKLSNIPAGFSRIATDLRQYGNKILADNIDKAREAYVAEVSPIVASIDATPHPLQTFMRSNGDSISTLCRDSRIQVPYIINRFLAAIIKLDPKKSTVANPTFGDYTIDRGELQKLDTDLLEALRNGADFLRKAARAHSPLPAGHANYLRLDRLADEYARNIAPVIPSASAAVTIVRTFP